MITINIFADSHKHFSRVIDEYTKRLGKNIKIHEIKPVKKGTGTEIIQKETEILKQKISKQRGFHVVLSPKGKNIGTKELYKLIEEKQNSGDDIFFSIGGANGLDYMQLQESIDFELSLGNMIFPHSLVFGILLEQVYRCSEIKKGSGYHK